ncbi:Phage gp6-like head-tail connector protein [compost metagenome]
MVTDVKFTEVEGVVIVSLEKAKKQLRIEASFTEEDDLIQGYIDAAIGASEDYTGGHILEKTMVLKLNGFENPFVFEAFPIQSIESIKYFSKDVTDEIIMPTENYSLTSVNPKVSKISFKTVPETDDRYDAVTISVKVGIEAAKMPKPIIQAILLQVADMYERREDRTEVNLTVGTGLLRPYKKF